MGRYPRPLNSMKKTNFLVRYKAYHKDSTVVMHSCKLFNLVTLEDNIDWIKEMLQRSDALDFFCSFNNEYFEADYFKIKILIEEIKTPKEHNI